MIAKVTTTATTWRGLTLLILTLLNLAKAALDPSALQTAKQWKLFTYNFQPHAPVDDANFYNPSNVVATGVAVGHDRIFIATPKLFSGVPATVSYVKKSTFGDSPVLQAYPDWSFSTTGRTDFNCSDLVLISVYRMRIDTCNRLWVLDAGVSRSLEDYEITCPPKILVIDLQTDQVVRRVDFPKEILRGESLFTNLVVDETTSKSSTCDDVFAYISDTVEPALIVYDSGRDVTWRVSHPAMYPDPDFAESEILNHRFVLMDGVVGLTFDERAGIVYFQPLATDRIFSVTKETLRAGPLAQNQMLEVKLVGKKSSQGIGLAVSPYDGSLLFSPMSETAIASWNPHTNQQSVLAYDRDRLQFVADMSTTPFEPGVVYIVTSKFHRFFLKNLNTKEFNNRILRVELPGAAIGPTATALVASNYPIYAYKGLSASSAPYTNGYYDSNSIEKINPPAHSSNYFSSSAATIQRQPHPRYPAPPHPYSYEPVGIINYSVRNPFTALNHGEAFPPNKANRETNQRSYLDSLVGSAPSYSPQNGLKSLHSVYPSLPLSRGYLYGADGIKKK